MGSTAIGPKRAVRHVKRFPSHCYLPRSVVFVVIDQWVGLCHIAVPRARNVGPLSIPTRRASARGGRASLTELTRCGRCGRAADTAGVIVADGERPFRLWLSSHFSCGRAHR